MGIRGYFAMAKDLGKATVNKLIGRKPSPEPKYLQYDSSPLLVKVNNFYQVPNIGSVVAGTVLRGELAPGDRLRLMPAGKEVSVTSIEFNEEKVHKAVAGMDVGVLVDGVGLEHILPDSVLVSMARASAQ